MKRVTPRPGWPESWKRSFARDLLEIYGEMSEPGYACAYANRRQHTLELVRWVARPGARILDVAAAQGNFTLSLAEMGYEVTWNDLREELAGYVKLKHESGTVHYAPGNILTLDFEASFDLVLITEIIEHAAHPDRFLSRIAQFVRPGGHVVMTTPNGEYFKFRQFGLPKFSECSHPELFEAAQYQPDSDGHIFHLYLDELDLLARQAGLAVLEVRLFTNPLTNGHLRSEALLRRLPRWSVDALEGFTGALPLAFRRRLHTTMGVLFQRPPLLCPRNTRKDAKR